jgi:hypothetical protein
MTQEELELAQNPIIADEDSIKIMDDLLKQLKTSDLIKTSSALRRGRIKTLEHKLQNSNLTEKQKEDLQARLDSYKIILPKNGSKGASITAKLKARKKVEELTEETYSGLYKLITLLGDPQLIRNQKLTIDHLLILISNSFECGKLEAAEILETLNGIIFDTFKVHNRIAGTEDSYNTSYEVRVGFTIRDFTKLAIGQTPLPMVEIPEERKKYNQEAGGYKASYQRGYMLKNSASQINFDPVPLNHLQSQKYRLNFELFNVSEYYAYLIDSYLKQYGNTPLYRRFYEFLKEELGEEHDVIIADMFKREAYSIANPGISMSMNENEAKYAMAIDKFKQSLGFKSKEHERFKKYLQALNDFKQTAIVKARQTKDRLAVFDKEDQIYFVWELDSRGRIYSRGYGINIQSDSYLKALLSPIID